MYNQFQNNASQSTFGQAGSVNSQYRGYQAKYQPVGFVQSHYTNQKQANPQDFHTASYRGNQWGHDAQWRSDSQTPTNLQQQYTQTAQNNQSNQNFGTGTSYQSSYSSYQQSPQSFHTANYRGNQWGHDAYLRSDSQAPTQSYQAQTAQTQQYGAGINSFMPSSYGFNSRQF
ncbi:hypothetical protein [Paenibacillus thalictri]|uniref:Uncharacterized protein n=1 Tax=Paenibacillus thalictri TaxID=2527873 RepID=A0A4Q9DU91_9BACL|nr:hypothetical protein [Paenibacillus thalictri]TBL78267.1 hypothetical protein EYB31_15480 [Paenibacillus thalictri]